MASMENDDHYSNNRNRLDTSADMDSNIAVSSKQRPEGIKRPRILSTVGATNSGSHYELGETGNDDHSSEQRESINNVYKKPEAVQRNKRIFGALMGHLGVAKRKLEEDSSNIEKRSARQMAVIQKNGMESRRLEQLHREASNSYKAKVLQAIFCLSSDSSILSNFPSLILLIFDFILTGESSSRDIQIATKKSVNHRIIHSVEREIHLHTYPCINDTVFT